MHSFSRPPRAGACHAPARGGRLNVSSPGRRSPRPFRSCPPLTASWREPGPWIVRLLLMTSVPLVSELAWPASGPAGVRTPAPWPPRRRRGSGRRSPSWPPCKDWWFMGLASVRSVGSPFEGCPACPVVSAFFSGLGKTYLSDSFRVQGVANTGAMSSASLSGHDSVYRLIPFARHPAHSMRSKVD